MKKKYMFFDIDGTLTTGGMQSFIPQSTKDTLQALRKEGHMIALATGRPYALTKDIANELEIDSYICNGGNTVIYKGEKIMDEVLNQEHVQRLIQDCIIHDFPYCISEADDFHFITPELSKLPPFQDEFIKQHLKEATINPRMLTHIKRLMIFITREQQSDLTIFENLVPQRYDDAYVMVEPDDKYKGIKKLMAVLQAPLEDVVVFGDGENDIKMFQQAAFAIAVGNACTQLKEIADYVTKRSDEDGIQHACFHFGYLKASMLEI